jgi:phosphoribosylaminoimidazole-succinocarboxamide synthase
MLCKKAKTIPVECVARGYITGSLYKEYRTDGCKVHGFDFPEGLVDSDRLPEPIFTPATKSEQGHDENISFAEMVNRLGIETKFEFGETPDGIILIDEVLTPDSSRYWDAALYAPSQSQPSFDKQFVRDYLETIGWDKNPPGPVLPAEIVLKTREKYIDAFRRIVGCEPSL